MQTDQPVGCLALTRALTLDDQLTFDAAADLDRALAAAFAIMDAYNPDPTHSRIEYVSDEMLERMRALRSPWGRLAAAPMSGDCIYPTAGMVDLAGKKLRTKRHGRNQFLTDCPQPRVETLDGSHVAQCMALLDRWKHHADVCHEGQVTEDEANMATAVLRSRETSACELALTHFRRLGLAGMVVYAGEQLAGFILGQRLSPAQGAGVGGALLDDAIETLRRRDARHVYLEVCCNNELAVKLYERRGFRCVRILRDYYLRGVHALSMRLGVVGQHGPGAVIGQVRLGGV